MKHNDKLVEIFVRCDDFYKEFEIFLQAKGMEEPLKKKRSSQKCSLSPSEIMAIVIFYHLSGFKCFKYFYQQGILKTWKSYFPDAVSYNRLIELKKEVNIALFFFIHYSGLGRQTGIYYIDSTKLQVCDNHRIHSHKVFKTLASRGKTSTGWFYGLKLHIVTNEQGELMGICITSGNVSDANAEVVKQLTQNLNEGGKLFADAGYVSIKLFEIFWEQGIHLFTKIRTNMKNKLLTLQDKFLLKKRTIVETIFDLLKNWMDLWHPRHRSIDNGYNNLLAGLAAYSFMDQKPSIKSIRRNLVLDLMSNPSNRRYITSTTLIDFLKLLIKRKAS